MSGGYSIYIAKQTLYEKYGRFVEYGMRNNAPSRAVYEKWRIIVSLCEDDSHFASISLSNPSESTMTMHLISEFDHVNIPLTDSHVNLKLSIDENGKITEYKHEFIDNPKLAPFNLQKDILERVSKLFLDAEWGKELDSKLFKK